jgi:thiamine biosynthesis lipoprotein
VEFQPSGDQWAVRFKAMAGPCEVILDEAEAAQARSLGERAAEETLRIQAKFSRYRDDNIIHEINTSAGRPVTVDPETAGLLNFAASCHQLSNGRFDITSGVLRRLWRFDGGDKVPGPGQVKRLLPLIGWDKIGWEDPVITLPEGMEIDLGGIGKEYAVDRVVSLLAQWTRAAVLVNFGGDLRAHGRRRDGKPWRVGVERPGLENIAALNLELKQGALATSGDANRYLLRDGKRYGHILNPRTGWPVRKAPRSVTVLADTCTQAGLLATLAMLQGGQAEQWLAEQGGQHWVIR